MDGYRGKSFVSLPQTATPKQLDVVDMGSLLT